MRLGEFKLRYQVLQEDDGRASRIIFRDLPRDLFDLIPLKSRTHDFDGQGPEFSIKSMNKLGCEWWFITNEDKNGNPWGVLPPEEEKIPDLIPLASIVIYKESS